MDAEQRSSDWPWEAVVRDCRRCRRRGRQHLARCRADQCVRRRRRGCGERCRSGRRRGPGLRLRPTDDRWRRLRARGNHPSHARLGHLGSMRVADPGLAVGRGWAGRRGQRSSPSHSSRCRFSCRCSPAPTLPCSSIVSVHVVMGSREQYFESSRGAPLQTRPAGIASTRVMETASRNNRHERSPTHRAAGAGRSRA